jgi:hypothetical protein
MAGFAGHVFVCLLNANIHSIIIRLDDFGLQVPVQTVNFPD